MSYHPDPTALRPEDRTALQAAITALDGALDAITSREPAFSEPDGLDRATDLAPLMDARQYLFDALGIEWDPVTPDWDSDTIYADSGLVLAYMGGDTWHEGEPPRTDEERQMLATLLAERAVDAATHAVEGVDYC